MSPYEVLVRLYPADQPRDEMLGVLEENARPWPYEAPALLLGALRARTGGSHPPRLRWLYATRAAALILLVAGATAPVLDLRYGIVLLNDLMIATWICAGLAATAVMLGARLPALGLSLSALLLSGTDLTSVTAIAAYTLAAVLLLIPGPSLPVRNPLPIALAVVWAVDYTLPAWVQSALLLALLAWTFIDERILLATGLALLAGLVAVTDDVVTANDPRSLLILAGWRLGLPAALVAVGALLTHRRAQT
ncbi:hypothetical protein AB0J83_32580 [Actinoplanes sp. NPDC049596]|uniref:hypothetical protein n=1 Tax=unclassified Actinoplanes TaxID=2626549 RepID=UPI0034343914